MPHGFENTTYGLHCSFFLGLLFRILNIELAKSKKGTTMETMGTVMVCMRKPLPSGEPTLLLHCRAGSGKPLH